MSLTKKFKIIEKSVDKFVNVWYNVFVNERYAPIV